MVPNYKNRFQGLIIPSEYSTDADLLKGSMIVECCANGKNDEAFLGEATSSKTDGSFRRDKLSSKAFKRFVKDGYIEQVPGCPGWFKKA